ncbi:MAG TPA: EamA family transporter [Candidatus Dormibacteraeota bacterium]|nr:EamA family transporter [Candidatus Dormibacteraeota bacterium]HWP76545.1 EamA family transporter [Methylomirabilota bacterium]
MTVAALLLVAGAAVLHAGWNALAKRAGEPVLFLWWVGVVASGLYAPIALAVLGREGFRAAAIPFVIGTVLLHALYFFSLGRAYAAGDYSLVYPIARGLGVALVPMAAFALFDERLSPLGTLGVILVAAGIFFVHWGLRGRPGAESVAPRHRSGTGWALATGVLIAAYSLLDRAGVSRMSPLAYIWLMELGSCVLLAPVALARRDALGGEWRRNRATIVAAALMSPTAYLLVLFAFQLSKTGYVVAAREMSIVLSAIIGAAWMKEDTGMRRLAGAAVVLAGVACVALAR